MRLRDLSSSTHSLASGGMCGFSPSCFSGAPSPDSFSFSATLRLTIGGRKMILKQKKHRDSPCKEVRNGLVGRLSLSVYHVGTFPTFVSLLM